MASDPTPSKPDELAELRNYIEQGYQGALDANPNSYSGAARIAFADYVMTRMQAYIAQYYLPKDQAARDVVEARLEEYQLGLLAGAMPESIGKPIATQHLAELRQSQKQEEPDDMDPNLQ